MTGSIRSVALDWEDKVNELLGTSGADVERSQNPEDYMYPSDFGTVEELVEAEIGMATRIQTEGSVSVRSAVCASV